MVEIEDDDAGDEAVDAEEVPAAMFEPGAEPSQGGEAGEETEDHPEQGGEDGAVEVEWEAGGGGFVRGVEQA